MHIKQHAVNVGDPSIYHKKDGKWRWSKHAEMQSEERERERVCALTRKAICMAGVGVDSSPVVYMAGDSQHLYCALQCAENALAFIPVDRRIPVCHTSHTITILYVISI